MDFRSVAARRLLAICILALAFMPIACPGREPASSSNNNVEAKPVDRANPYNVTAQFLAGNDIPAGTPLAEFAATPFYKGYREQITATWQKFQKPNHDKIAAWWKKHRFSTTVQTVLYPFSGPDILTALDFYPKATRYIMFGLEQPGIAPEISGMTPAQITAGLNGMRRALGTILRVNFFKTEGMAVDLGGNSFNSIAGLIMFFLAQDGCTVTGVRRIAINEKSEIVDGIASDMKIQWQTPPVSRVPGVEIRFIKDNRECMVQYFMLNVIDDALANKSPNFVPWLKKQGPFGTVLKSASYLMHNDTTKFVTIRKAIMASTNWLVQDDSGIPLKHFKPDTWKLGFHGMYDGPIPLFAGRYQKDFRKNMDEKSTGRLPFSYGYDYKPGESNLMTAERKGQKKEE